MTMMMMLMPSTSTGSTFIGLATQQARNLPTIIISAVIGTFIQQRVMNNLRCAHPITAVKQMSVQPFGGHQRRE